MKILLGRHRRDDAVLGWLRAHPDSESFQAAVALGLPILSTHRRLCRLEREGRVESAWISGTAFDHTVYRASPETTGAAR